jgi:hypothetical protein
LENIKQIGKLKSPGLLDADFSQWIMDAIPIKLAQIQISDN